MAKTTKKPARKAKPAAPKHEHAGQPTAYKPEYAEQAKKLCGLLGATDDDLAEFFGVCDRTIRNWRREHAEFNEACRIGKDAADDRVEESLYRRAKGYSHEAVKIFYDKDAGEVFVPYTERFPPDTAAAAFWLKNRRPKLWRDRNQHELSGPDGGPIKTEGGMSDREAARMIAELLMRGAESTAPAPGGTLADDAGPDA